MRFGTLGGRFGAVADGRFLDLGVDALSALADVDSLSLDWSLAVPFAEADLGPPVPNPRQVFAIALNYRPHALEAGFVPPDAPLVFTKFPSCITGPVSTVELPPGNVDWEIEVVAVIGRGGHRIPRSDAWSAVAGLTLGQDLSERVGQLQGTPPQFSLAKSYPGFGPTGPLLVTLDELPSPLTFSSTLYPGQEVLQEGSTADLIFPIDDLVARLSSVCPLLPGDLIFTGTPAGVGNRRNPPRFLRPGETLVSRLDGVGELRQTFTSTP
jgi:2-keto-4-pentenoate hydratase/2-oxohepta-3-ene-1,7-dioic acid hydratase in catechol pathway